MSIHVTTKINGDVVDYVCDADETLLDVLRNRLGLTGAKEGCGKGDGSSTGWQTPAYGHPSDDRGEVRLFEIDHCGFVASRRDTSLFTGYRLGQIPRTEPPEGPDAGSDQEDERDGEAPKSAGCFGSQMGSVRV